MREPDSILAFASLILDRTSDLATPTEAEALLRIAAIVAFGLLVWSIPTLRKPTALVVVTFVAGALIYRGRFASYLALLVAVYVAAVGIARSGEGTQNGAKSRWTLACAAIGVLVVVFLGGRVLGLDLPRSETVFGLNLVPLALDMWVLLRLCTFCWEIGSGRIVLPTAANYFLWSTLPFTTHGPLLRYSEFDKQREALHAPGRSTAFFSRSTAMALLLAIVQLVTGLVLGFVQTALLAQPDGRPRWVSIFVWFVTAPWTFYLLFSGYFRLSQCFARLWRIELPESFDYPFGQANLADFWARWNMTATAVFRDYLFYNRWGFRRVNVYLNTLVLFLTVGVWHGFNAYWILWGLLHGVGFCAYLAYKRRRQAHPVTPIAPRWLARGASIVVTYVFVCSCWAAPSVILKIVDYI